MKAIQVLKLAGGAILVAASLQANAQTTDQSTAAPAAAASPTDAARQQLRQSRSEYRAKRAANRRLERQVRTALARDGRVSVSNITVRARDGAVTLQGSVPEAPQLDRATQAAKGVAGVTSVRNALTIRPVGS
ncbi:BON domain-containing protein [Paraburkholderia caballeronis]|uniref:BON domain-containing protein n=1 Tax=Paraburkholderia caballeronis TaxID=416943 RepID=A0A1H7NXG5_9BURK|nr:BON domain-containing protein [Paraburkholderia caballeronis]PXW25490.1 BON domain-containing protein [Paraburkholderia caballeronis]PXX01097.1 BON domain-containing protein [Paraburkholderia caballeronis]RAJ99550.1 BON domain-containing protein [Paraburkholderia caballeronis]TDV11471.1 BON domain-containing protein [Paraburkholderia caballeronis]TDV14661.1 BON domain-containing protein [Paraburkholderia caballeronis]